MSASTRILALVQANPEISTTYDATDLANCIEAAKDFLTLECRLPVFPDALQGYSQSAASPSTNITALANNELLIDLNGSGLTEIALTLAGLTSGAAIATQIQTQIRAVDLDDYGFDEVTVTYTSSVYTITSGRYGEDSSVKISFEETNKAVAQNLKLSPAYGGVEKTGSALDSSLERVTARLVEEIVAKRGAEGVYDLQVSNIRAIFKDLDPIVLRGIHNRRRMWT